MSNFGGTWGQLKKMKFILGISLFLPTGDGFLILKQIIHRIFQNFQKFDVPFFMPAIVRGGIKKKNTRDIFFKLLRYQ
jgi:hypothetical protein